MLLSHSVSPMGETALPFDHDFLSSAVGDAKENRTGEARKWAGRARERGREGCRGKEGGRDKRSLGARYRSSLRVRVEMRLSSNAGPIGHCDALDLLRQP